MSTNTYIIALFTRNPSTNQYEKKDDCTMSFNINSGDLKIVSADDNNDKNPKIYLFCNVINENIMILSRERNNISSMYNAQVDLTIDYEMYYDNKKFGIRFDSRSSSADKNFFNEFNKIREKVKTVVRYPSQNIKMEGMKTKDGFTGYCIEYYDVAESTIKYMGEFEDNKYDGEGEFFSQDGNIRLLCKNICNGKPNGIGKLIIGRNRVVKNIEMKNYSDLDTQNPKYTNMIYAKIEPKYDELMELFNFEAMTTEDRTMYLMREIQKLRTKNNDAGASLTKGKSFLNLF